MRKFMYDVASNSLDSLDLVPEGEYNVTIESMEICHPKKAGSQSYFKLIMEVNSTIGVRKLFDTIHPTFLKPLQKICQILEIDWLEILERNENCAPDLVGKRIRVKIKHKKIPFERNSESEPCYIASVVEYMEVK